MRGSSFKVSSSVQFRGAEQVLAAYSNREAEYWSIWQGHQFMFKGCGEGELQGILEMMQMQATDALYTLRVYEEVQSAREIKSTTPDDGSFNFKLGADSMEINNAQYGRLEHYLKKISDLEEEIRERDREEEETINVNRLINGMIEDPQKLGQVVGIVQNLFGGNRVAAVGSTGTPDHLPPNYPYRAGGDPGERIAAVLDRLQVRDPKIIEHLEKLAEIAEKNPGMFSLLITQLEKQ